jgi:hypothetical protein
LTQLNLSGLEHLSHLSNLLCLLALVLLLTLLNPWYLSDLGHLLFRSSLSDPVLLLIP